MTYPAFRFTDWLDTRTQCESWLEHFNKKSIPCAIVYGYPPPAFKTPDVQPTRKRYSVWRIGTEVRCESTSKTRKARAYVTERIEGEIIASHHLFKEYLR